MLSRGQKQRLASKVRFLRHKRMEEKATKKKKEEKKQEVVSKTKAGKRELQLQQE